MNKWQNHVNVGYNYTLESITSKSQLKKEVCEFIYGVCNLKGNHYSQASLKNAISSISRYLREVKSDWNYNLLNKSDFPDIFATLDGTLKEIKKLGIGTAKPYDGITNNELKVILHYSEMSSNNPNGLLRRVFLWICLFCCSRGGGINRNQHTFELPFPEDIPGIAESNTDIKKYIAQRPQNYKTKKFYLSISQNAS
ncbi:4688_t:CDS:2, partial [Acaulospora morrowiae]